MEVWTGLVVGPQDDHPNQQDALQDFIGFQWIWGGFGVVFWWVLGCFWGWVWGELWGRVSFWVLHAVHGAVGF